MKYLFFLLVIGCYTCGNSKKNIENTSDNTISIGAASQKHKTVVSYRDSIFSTDAGVVTIQFFKWYKANYDIIRKFEIEIIDYHINDGTNKPYDLDLKKADVYLNKLKSSGMLSDKYIQYRRSIFIDCDQELSKEPQYDCAPCGLSFDPVLFTQEGIDFLTNGIDHPINMGEKVTKNIAEVILNLEFMTYKILLTKNNSNWEIDSIGVYKE